MHADDAASQLTVLLLRGTFLGLLLAVVTWTASGRARPVVSFISSQTIGSRLSTAVLGVSRTASFVCLFVHHSGDIVSTLPIRLCLSQHLQRFQLVFFFPDVG